MNNHIILGVLASEIKILKSNKEIYFASFVVQDATKYNGKGNEYNDYHIVRYDKVEELEKLKETMSMGTAVYISGTGLYNKKKYYNIIANDITPLNNLNVNIVQERCGYYEQFFSSEKGDEDVE